MADADYQELQLKVTNRGKKGALRSLPETLGVDDSSTIEQLRVVVAMEAGVSDFNRIGIFNPKTRKIISDRKLTLRALPDVLEANEILVQDLGPQISWRLVFVVEYAGPILIHTLFYLLRPRIPLPAAWKPASVSAAAAAQPTDIQTLAYVLFLLHFVKRELETLFLHRFSASTMPLFNIFRNSAFYWLLAGWLSAWSLYAPFSPFRISPDALAALTAGSSGGSGGWHGLASAPRAGFGSSPLDYAGLVLFFVSEACNFSVHYHLAHLRSPGGTEKGIPHCIGSSLVTSPNYMFEVLAWVGVILITRDLAVVAFISTGVIYMRSWSRGKERALRKLFPDRYKKKRYTMLPGLI